MSFKFIKAGNRADIALKTREEDIMPSRVENVLPEPELLIRAPVINRRYRVLPDNTEIFLYIYTENGIFKFNSNVSGSVAQPGFSMLRVSIAGDGERVQRRNFFRMDCLIPFHFRHIADISDIIDANNADKGVILDISGGGFRFAAKEKLEKGMLIKGLIKMETEAAPVTGRILFVRQAPESPKFEYRVKFEGLPDEVSESIVKYVLQLQREQLRREQNLNLLED